MDQSQGLDCWYAGGLMERLSSHLDRNDSAGAVRAAREHTHLHKRAGKKLLFVYDLVASDSGFDTLKYVLDAVRPPFTSATFEQIYGIPRYLQFERRSERANESVDVWAGIYA